MNLLKLKKNVERDYDFVSWYKKENGCFKIIHDLIKIFRYKWDSNQLSYLTIDIMICRFHSVYFRWSHIFLAYPEDLLKYYTEYLNLIIKYFEEERRRHNRRVMFTGMAGRMINVETSGHTYLLDIALTSAGTLNIKSLINKLLWS